MVSKIRHNGNCIVLVIEKEININKNRVDEPFVKLEKKKTCDHFAP